MKPFVCLVIMGSILVTGCSSKSKKAKEAEAAKSPPITRSEMEAWQGDHARELGNKLGKLKTDLKREIGETINEKVGALDKKLGGKIDEIKISIDGLKEWREKGAGDKKPATEPPPPVDLADGRVTMEEARQRIKEEQREEEKQKEKLAEARRERIADTREAVKEGTRALEKKVGDLENRVTELTEANLKKISEDAKDRSRIEGMIQAKFGGQGAFVLQNTRPSPKYDKGNWEPVNIHGRIYKVWVIPEQYRAYYQPFGQPQNCTPTICYPRH